MAPRATRKATRKKKPARKRKPFTRRKPGESPKGVPPAETIDSEYANKLVDVLDALADPDPRTSKSVAQIARDLGLTPRVAGRIVEKIRGRYVPLLRAAEDVKTRDLGNLAKYNAWRLGTSVAGMTDDELKAVPFQQRALAFGIFTDKHLLLDGKPTEILSVQQLEGLDDLARMLMAEARRRGVEVSIDPETGAASGGPARTKPRKIEALLEGDGPP